jgi:hypothetical protein
MGLQLWCRNQKTVFTLEESCFTLLQDSTTSVLVGKNNAACLFWSSRHCALWIHSWS